MRKSRRRRAMDGKEDAGGVPFMGHRCIYVATQADHKGTATDGKLQSDGSYPAKPCKQLEGTYRDAVAEMRSNGPECAARSEHKNPATKKTTIDDRWLGLRDSTVAVHTCERVQIQRLDKKTDSRRCAATSGCVKVWTGHHMR